MQNGLAAVITARAPGSAVELTTQPAALFTTDGLYVTSGTAELTARDGAWSAVLRRLEAPGAVASLYFGRGVRDIVVRLGDGRRVRARLTDTRFGEDGRVYTLSGRGPLPAAGAAAA
jgi:hypothetical protein